MKLRLLRRSATTLHIEGNDVRLMVTKGRRITRWGIEPLEPGLVREGVIADPEAVGRHIRSLLDAHRAARQGLVASLSGQRCVTRILDFPDVSARLLRQAVPREVRRQMLVPVEDMHLSWQVVGGADGQLQVFTLGVPREVLRPQLHAITLAGGRLRSVDLKPLALVRAVGRSEALIVDLEPQAFDVVVVRRGVPAAIRTVGLRAGAGTTEDRIRRLGEELTGTVKFYNDTHPREPLPPETPAYLTGSMAEAAAEAGVVEASTGHAVEPLTPGLPCPRGLPLASFMVNIGLALKKN